MLSPRKTFDLGWEGERDPRGLASSLAAATLGVLVEGNAAEVVQNGTFFDRLGDDLAAARATVHLENYLWKPGAVCDRVISELESRARSGCEVRVVYDAVGASDLDGAEFERLGLAGAKIAKHRQRLAQKLAYMQRRDHRKLAVIDGRVAWLFGHAIADEWSAREPAGKNSWRDTAVRFEGPVVNQLQSAFLAQWAELSGEVFSGPRYFPRQETRGGAAVHLAYVAPIGGRSAVQRLYYAAIQAARRELIIQNPYFLPDRTALHHLREAASRGARVRIMLPAPSASDVPMVQHGSHHFFGSLLEREAEIHEYGRAGLHQKVIIVDREWCCVGSTNFDGRSLLRNDEISAGIVDQKVIASLVAAFEEDLDGAKRWTADRWSKRSRAHQLADFSVALLRGQL